MAKIEEIKSRFDWWMEYCRAIIPQRNVIAMAVADAKQDRIKARANALDAMGIKVNKYEHFGIVPFVQCNVEGQVFVVTYPEKWLEVIDDAFGLAGLYFGANVKTALECVYLERKKKRPVCIDLSVNYQVFSGMYDREFILFAVSLAAKEGLLPEPPALEGDKTKKDPT